MTEKSSSSSPAWLSDAKPVFFRGCEDWNVREDREEGTPPEDDASCEDEVSSTDEASSDDGEDENLSLCSIMNAIA
jgi:hypothetical protein